MLGLTLRDEFRGQHLPPTAISLVEPDGSGATQVAPARILAIIYPTADIQTALRAISGTRAARPMVLQGSRGKGKSHLLALLHHAVASSDGRRKAAKPESFRSFSVFTLGVIQFITQGVNKFVAFIYTRYKLAGMAKGRRADDQAVEAFSASKSLLKEAKRRAAEIGMSKSGYFRSALAKDLGYDEGEAKELAFSRPVRLARARYAIQLGAASALNDKDK